MIEVSAGLRARFRQLLGREVLARVRIDYSDANIDNTVVAWASGTGKASLVSQVHNGKEDVSSKWASPDGSWLLDGTFKLAPSTADEYAQYEIGWWSEQVSLPDGTFDATGPTLLGDGVLLGDAVLCDGSCGVPTLNVNFLPRTISEIRIAFDNARGEYAVDFTVVITDSAGTVLHTQTVTGNAGYKYVAAISPVNLAAQMTLRITRWSAGGRQAKVAEMLTAVSELYEGDDIMNLRVIESREITGNGLPVGHTVAGECVVSLYNRFRQFDYDNTTSKLYNLVRKNNRITVWLGDGVEWVQVGVFYAREWDISKRGATVTVTGLDRMAMLDDSEFSTSKIVQPPADQTFLLDTAAEWGFGTRVGVEIVGNQMRMVLS